MAPDMKGSGILVLRRVKVSLFILTGTTTKENGSRINAVATGYIKIRTVLVMKDNGKTTFSQGWEQKFGPKVRNMRGSIAKVNVGAKAPTDGPTELPIKVSG